MHMDSRAHLQETHSRALTGVDAVLGDECSRGSRPDSAGQADQEFELLEVSGLDELVAVLPVFLESNGQLQLARRQPSCFPIIENRRPLAAGLLFSVTVTTQSRPPEKPVSKSNLSASSLSAPTGTLRRRLYIAVPLSVGLALVCGLLTGLIGRFVLGLPASAGANIAGHALTAAVAGMFAGSAAVVLYEHWASRTRANDKVASQALTSGAIGAVISAVMAALVNGIVIGVPTSLATQTANQVVTGIISGAIAAFIGLMVHQAKTAVV
jgi:hypothetical protein